MRVSSEAWEAITRIINNDFIRYRQPLTPNLLIELIREVSEEYSGEEL